MSALNDRCLSIIIPAFNEEEGVGVTVRRCKGALLRVPCETEIIVVDDGSTDSTAQIAKDAGARVIRLDRNRGKGIALKVGYAEAKGDILAMTDADGSYPVERIPEMVKDVVSGEADLVIGSRFLPDSKSNLPAIRRVGNKILSYFVSFLTRSKITDSTSGLRVFRRDILPLVEVKAKGLDYEIEMTTLALRKKVRLKEVPIIYSERIGRSKLRIVRDGIRFTLAVLRAMLSESS